MLNAEGEPKIGDFGIAQRTVSDSTQVVGMYGSSTYMLPEQARDDDLTPQTDLYSFGVVMYEVLAGRPPFRARGFSGLLNKILNEEPPYLKEFRPEVSDELVAVVNHAMSKSLDDRYQTAAEIAAVMEELKYPSQVSQELSVAEKFALVRPLAFFSDFSDDEVEEVMAVALWESFNDGEMIMPEGQNDSSFAIILSGEVPNQNW